MLTYAKAGGPPLMWHGLKIIDLSTGEEVREVVEVNTEEGWLKRHAKDADGKVIISGDEFVIERIDGSFRIDDPSGLAEKFN